MNAGDATSDEAVNLIDHPGDPDGTGGFGIGDLERGAEAVWRGGLGESDGAVELGGGGDGHEAGEDGGFDAGRAGGIHEAEEDVIVEEKLGVDEVGTGIEFCLEVTEVIGEGGGFGMDFRITGDSAADVGVKRFDEGDEVRGVGKAIGGGGEGGFTAGWIAAQGHDIANAGGVDAIDLGGKVAARGTDAGEMGDDRSEAHAGEEVPSGEGMFPRRTASAIGAGDEVGVDGAHAFDGAAKNVEAVRIFWGIEFKRERRLAAPGKEVPDGRRGHGGEHSGGGCVEAIAEVAAGGENIQNIQYPMSNIQVGRRNTQFSRGGREFLKIWPARKPTSCFAIDPAKPQKKSFTATSWGVSAIH